MQKFSSFLTSASATSWGVVTTIAPSAYPHSKNWTRERCSSEVPGGALSIEMYCRWSENLVHPSLLPVKTAGSAHFYGGLSIWLHRFGCSSRIRLTWQPSLRCRLATILVHSDELLAPPCPTLWARSARRYQRLIAPLHIFAIEVVLVELRLCFCRLLPCPKGRGFCVWYFLVFHWWFWLLGWLQGSQMSRHPDLDIPSRMQISQLVMS